MDKKTLEDVKCPCLFIVGGNDKKLIEINRMTIDQLTNVEDKELKLLKVHHICLRKKVRLKKLAMLQQSG